MTEQEMVQKIYEVIKLVDCMQHNPFVDFNYLRAKGAYHIIKNQIEHIESENEQLKQTFSRMETVEKELRERLEKAVELPCKVGDTVWFFDSDRILKEGKISMLQCKSDGNWKMRITYNLVSYKTVFDDYCNKLGIKYFTDNTEAKARLAELRGE